MPLTPQFPYKIVIGFQYSLSLDIYRPQRSWGKVMFSQACVILFTGGCLPQCMLGYHPPGADPPGSRHIPRADTPLGADTPWEQTHPQEQTPPWDQTPLGPDTPSTEHAGRYGQCAGSTHPT